MKAAWLLSATFGSFLLFACTSNKTIVKVQEKNIGAVLDSMVANKIDYEWFSGKARVKFESSNSSMSGRCNVRMIKDSLIWMNFKKFSIEASRILLTRDSFWIKYPLDRMYEAGPLEELLDFYEVNLSFNEIQELIIGNFQIPSSDITTRTHSATFHEIDFTDSQVKYKYQIDDNYHVRNFSITDHLNRKIIGSYSNYREDAFAKRKDFTVSDNQGYAKVSFNFSNIEIDVPKSIKFDIPSHYYKLP